VGVIRSHDPVLHFEAQAIYVERMKLDVSNLVCVLNIKSWELVDKFCYLGDMLSVD